MRTFKTCRTRGLPFRLFIVLAGALLLVGAFVPRTHAQNVIAYFNFEDATVGSPPDFTSEADQGIGFPTTITTDYGPLSMTTVTSTFTNNRVSTDADPPLRAMALSRSGLNSGSTFDFSLNTSQGFFSNMTVSFAVNSLGNGFAGAGITFSTDGGLTFAPFVVQVIPNSGVNVISLTLPSAANNTPLLTIRIILTGGQSNDPNPQSIIDNIRVDGQIVPEPATVAGGLLGVLGLCWFQRRRLIRSLRLLRA